jgi:hypothetical protein
LSVANKRAVEAAASAHPEHGRAHMSCGMHRRVKGRRSERDHEPREPPLVRHDLTPPLAEYGRDRHVRQGRRRISWGNIPEVPLDEPAGLVGIEVARYR